MGDRSMFAAGGTGGPGRPKGSRNKLGELFLQTVLKDFEQHGEVALERVRNEDPSTYCRVVAGLLPKEITGADGEPLLTGITVTFVKPAEKP